MAGTPGCCFEPTGGVPPGGSASCLRSIPTCWIATATCSSRNRDAQKVLWRSSGNPGVVLVDAEPVAPWGSRKRSGRSHVAVEPLHAASPVDLSGHRGGTRRIGRLLDGDPV